MQAPDVGRASNARPYGIHNIFRIPNSAFRIRNASKGGIPMSLTMFLGGLQEGLFYALLAMGVYISFRILNTPDLTTEG